MAGRFAEKVVWITGASGGIGEALARAFSAEGARLVLSARRREKLEGVARDTSGTVLPLDMTDRDGFPAAVGAVVETYGRIDVLVHNAGISQRARADQTTPEDEQRLWDTNYFGPVRLTRAALPHLAQGGQIVVVSSVLGKFGAPARSTYAATKHALHGYFDSLRAETGLDVTLVCPGFVATEITKNAVAPGGGPFHGRDVNAAGLVPGDCARRIVAAAARRQVEVWMGGREVLGIWLSVAFPTWFARILARQQLT